MDYDLMLWRPLLPGMGFEGLLPKSNCKSTFVGNGYTDFTIDKMEDTVHEYYPQTAKLAAKLKQSTLQSTTAKIHWFLYNHLQYHADQSDQKLRSPACSWAVRQEGIDCKSYSIFASCLLLNLNITHYIRKIKQPGDSPENFTHVYVVVPKNQKTANLNDGYMVIDGTLPTTDEPIFIDKSDLQMMRHDVLNAPHQQRHSLNAGINIKSIMRKFSFKSITSIFSSIDCIGGSSFSEGQLKTQLMSIETFYQNLLIRINEAVQNNNYVEFSNAITEFYGMSKMFAQSSELKEKGGFNSCTTKRIKTSTKAYKFYRDVTGPLLTAWLQKYFVKNNIALGTKSFTNEGAEAKYQMNFIKTNPVQVVVENHYSYLPNLQLSIPMFELTKYVEDQTNSGKGVDIMTFLSGLQNIIQAVTPSGSGTNPANTPGTNTPGTGTGTTMDDYYIKDNDKNPAPQQAGFGTIAMVGIGLLALGAIMMKNNNPAK